MPVFITTSDGVSALSFPFPSRSFSYFWKAAANFENRKKLPLRLSDHFLLFSFFGFRYNKAMKITLNKQDKKKFDEMLNVGYDNISTSEMTNSFLDENYDALSKEAIDMLKNEYGYEDEDAMEEAFYRFLGLESQDPEVMKLRECNNFGHLLHLKEDEFLHHPFNQIPIKEAVLGPYQLKYNAFLPYEIFNEDDTIGNEENNFAEITYLGYFTKKVPYLMLTQKNEIWMSVTPHEIKTMKEEIASAKGRVLTFGLGLGYYAFEVSNKEEVESVTIIEKDSQVISLFEKNILPSFKHKEKIKIIKQDAFCYFKNQLKNDMYDTIFVDIYHTAEDALPLYIRFKQSERQYKIDSVHYWIEKSILCYIRRYFLVLFEECLNGYTSEDYKPREDDESKVLSLFYSNMKDMEFTSFEEIKNFMKDENIKKFVYQLK